MNSSFEDISPPNGPPEVVLPPPGTPPSGTKALPLRGG